MKKRIRTWILFIISMLVLVFVVIAIVETTRPAPEIPYGIWHSEEPNITLFIKPDYNVTLYGYQTFTTAAGEETIQISESDVFLGVYVKDGEEIDIFVSFLFPPREDLRIQNANITRPINSSNAYFAGSYRVRRNNRLYLRLFLDIQERTGIDHIVFELVEEVP